jgi:hypothetical protein
LSDQEANWLAVARQAVRESFPEMADAEPCLSSFSLPEGTGAHGQGPAVVTFQKEMPLPDGGSMRRVVRVTISPEGEVVKITSSR